MTELKACECARQADFDYKHKHKTFFRVRCDGVECNASNAWYDTPEKAAAAWNACAGDGKCQPHDWDRATAICQRCGKYAGSEDTPTWCAKINDVGECIATLESERDALFGNCELGKQKDANIALEAENKRLRESILAIRRRCGPKASRDFDEAIRDLDWIDDEARDALAEHSP